MLDHQAARRLRQGAYAACALALACAGIARAQSPDTTTLGGDAAHRNLWAGTGLRPPLDLAWQVAADPVQAPIVVSGRVVVQTAAAVSALDAATGTTLWSVPLTGGPADLASDGGRVFLASPAGVVALDLGDGRLLWRAPGTGASGPVAADGRVYVGTASGDVVARDASSGLVLWTADTRIAGARPAVAGSRVYVVGHCRATALNTLTGLPVWTTGSCGDDAGVRTVVAGAFAWGEDAALYLASDGTRVSPGPSPGTAGGGLVFANPLAAPTTALAAGDAGTFALRWTWKPPLPGVLAARPAVVDGSVFQLVDTKGPDGLYLAALDPGTGLEQWSGFLPLPDPPAALTPATTTAIAAGPGILVVPVPGGLAALRNAPTGPVGVEATLPRNVVAAGADTVITGKISSAGHGLVGPRAVALQADPFPFEGGYVPAGFIVAGRSGFSFTARVARNTRFRIAADGVFYPPTAVYALPSLSVSYKRTARKRIVRARLRIAAARGLRRAGGRVAVYRLKRRGRVATRLGAGRSASSGIARFTVRIPASLKRSDRIFTCLRGASRQGFGVANAIDRRCTDRRIRLPTASTASASVSPSGPYMGLYATRLP